MTGKQQDPRLLLTPGRFLSAVAQATGQEIDSDFDDMEFNMLRLASGASSDEDGILVVSIRANDRDAYHTGVWSCRQDKLLYTAGLSEDEYLLDMYWPNQLALIWQHTAASEDEDAYDLFYIDDYSTYPPERVTFIDTTRGFTLKQQYFMAGPTPELVIIGEDQVYPDMTAVVRVDVETAQTMVLHFEGNFSNDLINSAQYFNVLCTSTFAGYYYIWSLNTGRLLTRLYDEKRAYGMKGWLISPLAGDIAKPVNPRAPLRLILRHNEGGLFALHFDADDVEDTGSLEVWSIQLPESEINAPRWQDASDLEEEIPPQPTQLATDPAERAQLKQLYRLDMGTTSYSVGNFHGPLVVGMDDGKVAATDDMTVADLETGQVLTRLAVTEEFTARVCTLPNLLIFPYTHTVYGLDMPVGLSQRMYNTIQQGRDQLEQMQALQKQRKQAGSNTARRPLKK